ncbi:spermatogenesis-associated protein 48 [Hemibagrus wyckioides]|uniref:spermatogenesis-associated protein 48 n=1 Tax=Hemibagrus wyckioides TaxID=337641 RepID=UPI00266D0DE0|nr:spermatogenesis-associated protein 48 [Hemibagrus wyckioides]
MKKSWSRVSLLQQSCCQNRVATSRCLCRYMNIPYERGRYDIESFTARDSDAFIKIQPQASPPSPHAALAPLRDDVPLTEPHSGRLSAGARADLGLGHGDMFTHRVCTAPSDLRAETQQTHTPSFRPSPGLCEKSANRCWSSRVKITAPAKTKNYSSRERPDPGSTSPLGCEDLKRDAYTSVSPKSLDKALQNIYTPEAQRSCTDKQWDTKLTPPLKPPLEKMADPVSQCFTLKRYNSRPELWQTIGPHWNRHQIRASYNVKKPFSFTSPCPKSGQIPLYSGVIGSENMDNIDIPEKDFIPLTVLRTVLPPDTPTAHRPTIPGYTGKALHVRPHTAATSQPSSILTHQATRSTSTPSSHGRQAPLSRMIITVPPSNPFLQPKTPTPPIYS